MAGVFSCTKDDNTDDDNMVSVQIQNWNGEVDPDIVSFALSGIVNVRCFVDGPLPYLSSGGFPEAWESNDWIINLVMAKGTKRTKLASNHYLGARRDHNAGIGYGLGLRLDMDFFLLRFDCGWKGYDPARSGKDSWAIQHPNFNNNWAWYFAVGYPF
jgi:hypothetical protein